MTISADELKRFIPFDSMTQEALLRLLNQIQLLQLKSGENLFTRGDNDPYSVFLLQGTVLLTSSDEQSQVVSAKSRPAHYALSALKPRQYTGLAKSKVSIIRVETELVEKIISWDQVAWESTDGIEVTEIDSESDKSWVRYLFDTKAFLHLPTSNIETLFTTLEAVPVPAGHQIIKQGERGDYYYIIKQGEARVSRSAENRQEVTIATLKKGASFGEEALVSGQPRNANITMKTDSVLMRLTPKDFNRLLKAPLVKSVSLEDASDWLNNNTILIDTRFENEYRNNGRIKGSINMPLHMLRLKYRMLSPDKRYILYCDTGQRSASAAFLLGERGFDAYVLEGGLSALKT